MSTAEQILVIVLSATLALFLILAISAVIMVMVLIRRLQAVATKAEEVAGTASDIAMALRKTVGSLTFFHAARGVFDALSQFKKHKER